jgi:hypothetical protein
MQVIHEAREPVPRGAPYAIEDHQGAKDPSVSPALKKIRRDNRRKGCGDGVSQSEEQNVAISKRTDRLKIR